MQLTNRQIFYQHLGLPAHVNEALEIIKAEGIYIYDAEGRRFTDLVSGVSVSNIGHRHPKVLDAIHQQLDKYMHLMVYGKYIQSPQVKLAQKLAENLPKNLDSVFFVNSGSEAIEGALKLAKRKTGRSEMIAFKNAYHGSTHGALSVLGNEEMKYAYRPLLPDVHFLNFNNDNELEKITAQTACVIIETVQAEAGILIPKTSFMHALREKCDKTGTILIFDEIQMGFGRTGKLFAFEHYDVVPDILCLAKGMGGGMPIGAFVSSSVYMNLLTHNPILGHITTFGGHPVSCAAALASLEVILENDLHSQASEKGELFVRLLKNHASIQSIRQIGLMLAIELKPEHKVSKLVGILQNNGLIVDQFLFNNSSFRIAPPLTISIEEIQEVSKNVLKSLNEL